MSLLFLCCRVVSVQSVVFGGSIDLVSPQRLVVKQGKLKLWETGMFGSASFQKVYLVLCNDVMLIGTKAGKLMKSGGKVKHVLPLNGLCVEEVTDVKDIKHMKESDLSPTLFRISSLRPKSSAKQFIFSASTLQEKNTWLTVIRDSVRNFDIQLLTAQERNMNSESIILASMDDNELENKILKKKFNSTTSTANIVWPKQEIVQTKETDQQVQQLDTGNEEGHIDVVHEYLSVIRRN